MRMMRSVVMLFWMSEICTSGILVVVLATTTSTRRDSGCRRAASARSSCRRATTGMFLSPSCNVVTVTPLMALVAEFATSRLVMPARLARSGSMFSVTWKLSFCHSLRTRRASAAERTMSSTCEAIRRISAMSCALCAVAHVGLADHANLHRIVDRIGLQLADSRSARRAIFAVSTGCT